MICTQTYTIDRFNAVAVPERFQAEWHELCFGFAKKNYSRFNSLERIVSISAASCGGIRLEPSNDDAFLDSDETLWQRLSYRVIFSADVRETLGILPRTDWVYILLETTGNALNLYSGSKVNSVLLNDNNETVLHFMIKRTRIENGQRIYHFEEV